MCFTMRMKNLCVSTYTIEGPGFVDVGGIEGNGDVNEGLAVGGQGVDIGVRHEFRQAYQIPNINKHKSEFQYQQSKRIDFSNNFKIQQQFQSEAIDFHIRKSAGIENPGASSPLPPPPASCRNDRDSRERRNEDYPDDS
ncbi:hypothetical protein L2E82_35626 [Cichorium intybus]|uniref:Uncharacterized protein n=1 Tax=Cichorium intybus TaxID=13427 RepID=A0ACB9BPF8_CICIN|nr:hypothetical protein L2E82_35626 [Cichorium intybus]